MLLNFQGPVPVHNQKVTGFAHDPRMSGGDALLARDPEAVAWLAKVYAEAVNGARAWPDFTEKRLGAFLIAAGCDLAAAVKAAVPAVPVPQFAESITDCTRKFRGASFIAAQPADIAMHLNQRRLDARL